MSRVDEALHALNATFPQADDFIVDEFDYSGGYGVGIKVRNARFCEIVKEDGLDAAIERIKARIAQ